MILEYTLIMKKKVASVRQTMINATDSALWFGGLRKLGFVLGGGVAAGIANWEAFILAVWFPRTSLRKSLSWTHTKRELKALT
jgi:hypothetical protein